MFTVLSKTFENESPNPTGSLASNGYTAHMKTADCDYAGWPEHAQPLSDRARAGGGSGGALNADHLAPGGGGWFSHWLSLFMANNWDLICEEISKAPTTSALGTDRFPSLELGYLFIPSFLVKTPSCWGFTVAIFWECYSLTFQISHRQIKLDQKIMWVHCI